jgi:hypothetical protein
MNSVNADYATLEEAFGVNSFVAPEPPILRGDIGQVQEARQQKLKQKIETLGKRQQIETEEARRAPAECGRCASGTKCHDVASIPSESIARAYAEGGAKAAWELVPKNCRDGMMWHALKDYFDSDLLTMVFIGVALYVLLRK